MVYLDYCATTPVKKEVLDVFNEVCLDYPGNANSLHKLGVEANDLVCYATDKISNSLNLLDREIIYTSGATEANNLAIKGICSRYKNRGRHIITTYLEHSSISNTIKYLGDNGFEVDYVRLDDNGLVSLDHLRKLIREDTVLVSVSYVDSELGIRQPLKEIREILSDYPKCFFHVDCTQAMGKIDVDFSLFDTASVSAHKFYGLKGCGMLIKRKNLVIDPIIHGGKSTTVYRSGTPDVPLIVSMMKAVSEACVSLDEHYDYVSFLRDKIIDGLSKYEGVHINSTDKSIPYVINFSLDKIKSLTFVRAMDDYDIYISTKSACSSNKDISDSVYAVWKNRKYASNSVRISLSYLTSLEEVELFLKTMDKVYNKLVLEDSV